MANRQHHHHDHSPDPSPDPAPDPARAPDPAPTAPTQAADFATLGATFNDATRALVGGLWQNAVEKGGQGQGSVIHYAEDLATVQQGLQAGIQAGHAFSPFGDALNPTPRYQDNDAQTNFWANFIAQSNSLGQQAVQLVDSHDAAVINALIGELHSFQKTVTDSDIAQGGIFEARFDNELLGNTSTLGGEVAKMIGGLNTGNAALVAAAGDEMHANSSDVGGNNIPVTGGSYNADGLTAAAVLSTAATAPLPAAARAAPAVQAAPIAAEAAAASTPPHAAAPTAPPTSGPDTASRSHDDDAPGADHAAFHHHQMESHVFAQLWHGA